MKKTFRLIAMALMAGAIFTACNDKNGDGPNGGNKHYPEDVTITSDVKGNIKAGIADQVEITGTGFRPDEDFIYIEYTDDNGVEQERRISGATLTFISTRISFGIPIGETYIGKTLKVYLDRIGYDRMPITGDIVFVMPDVADGYIPDPAFRGTLMDMHPQNGNPLIAPHFNTYGLLDPGEAAKIDKINLYGSGALSLEGIELFKGASRLEANDMSALEIADFSKWKSSGVVYINMERSAALKKIIGGPCIGRLDCYDCPSLTEVDIHLSRWMYNFQLYNNSDALHTSTVTELDIRRQRTGIFKGGDKETNEGYTYCSKDDEYTALVGNCYMRVPGTCHIKVDYQFLLDKWSNSTEADPERRGGYGCVYWAWKNGATVDVYDSQDITKQIGTVPAYTTNSTAIGLPGTENSWKPTGY